MKETLRLLQVIALAQDRKDVVQYLQQNSRPRDAGIFLKRRNHHESLTKEL